MFVVQEAVAKNDASSEDLNGKYFVAVLIMFANGVAGGLYPLYRFFSAWVDKGQIDKVFVKDSLSRCFSCFKETELAGYCMSTCGCLIAAKDKADKANREVEELHATAQSYIEQVRQTETVSTTERIYNDAKSTKEHLDEGMARAAELKKSIRDVQDAQKDLQQEAFMSRFQTTDNQEMKIQLNLQDFEKESAMEIEMESREVAGKTDTPMAAAGTDEVQPCIYADGRLSLGPSCADIMFSNMTERLSPKAELRVQELSSSGYRVYTTISHEPCTSGIHVPPG